MAGLVLGGYQCKIDSLVQSWSVITGLGRPDRQEQSLASIYKHLVRPQDKVICLLTSPFVNSVPSPGYIQGYPAGLRENGGQYTHAAAWVVMAHAVAGMGSRAFELFQIVNPINHTKDTAGALRYQTEPYVTCGDVYSVPPHAGRGGWSWYTGSSGWLYRVAWEHILGLKIRGDKFAVEPCIPSAWKEFNMKVSLRGTTFNIKVLNPTNVERGVQSVQLEGQELPSKEIPFSAGQGNVVVIMG
ncbi:MAG: hypothetical protein DCC75_11950 [Proteobacteria bacterium]|nr:MAG: hypothetical protein DCC75_11950 [Pseudomonadota bacterium]